MEHFESFPQAVQDQKQAVLRKPNTVVNPNHPHNKPKVAAQGMTLAPPGAEPQPHRLPPGGMRPQVPQPMAAPVSMPQVGADIPVMVTPNSEVEAVSFALPSNFLFYDFKELYIRPFKGRHFAKLHKAKEEESLLHMLEAVSSVISAPQIPEGLAFYLTLPDYYACLYWLRLNSFLKHGFLHRTMCRNEKHHQKVESGELALDTLQHAETIGKASLKTNSLEALPDPEKFLLEHPGIKLVPPLMKDIVEILMNDSIDRFEARTASCFQFVDRNATLAERMAIIDDLSADDIATIGAYETAVSDYGVVETVRWTCKTCGVAHFDQIQLEAHSFFPSAA